jgi:hypothetical protein
LLGLLHTSASPACSAKLLLLLLLLLLLTSLKSRLIRRGLLLDMLAGVAKNESSSMASTLHVAVGEGGLSTATGEEGPMLALAEM